MSLGRQRVVDLQHLFGGHVLDVELELHRSYEAYSAQGGEPMREIKNKPKRVTKYMRLSSVRHLRRRRGDSQTIAKSLLKMNY